MALSFLRCAFKNPEHLARFRCAVWGLHIYTRLLIPRGGLLSSSPPASTIGLVGTEKSVLGQNLVSHVSRATSSGISNLLLPKYPLIAGFSGVHLGIVALLLTKDGKGFPLTCADRFTNKFSKTVLNAYLHYWISISGIPSEITTDSSKLNSNWFPSA